MNENVARLEQQVASAKAGSVLSNSINNDEGDRSEINQRASSMEQVTEEEGETIHRDESSYNITPNDIAAIP